MAKRASFRKPEAGREFLVVQRLEGENKGFTIGGGLNAGAQYQFAQNGFVKFNYVLNILPDMTTARMPENPDRQPATVSQETFFQQGINIGIEFRY